MAEIHVERKRSLTWLWALLLLVLVAAMLWWFLAGREGPTTVRAADESSDTMLQSGGVLGATAVGTSTLARFDEFVRSGDREYDGRVDAWAADGLHRLADAIDTAFAERVTDSGGATAGTSSSTPRLSRPKTSSRAEELRKPADRLAKDTMPRRQAEIVRDAFGIAATLLDSLVRIGATDSSARVAAESAADTASLGTVESVKAAARSVRRNRPLDQQREAVREFFGEANAALKNLSAAD